MTDPGPTVRHIDEATGEVLDECPNCRRLQDLYDGARRDIAAWTIRCADIRRDAEKDAHTHEHWNTLAGIFKDWAQATDHPRSQFTSDRFFLALPYLERDGERMIRKAIAGAAFDPYTTKRRNGTTKRHDGWELIFKNRGSFEEMVNRAPRASTKGTT